MNTGRKIAFFDLDGTLTTRDTLPEIIRFQKGNLCFYTGFLLHAPWLIAYKMKWIANDTAKQKILRYFFGGMKAADFRKRCDRFAETRLPGLIRPGALREIDRLKAAGVEIVIVSASAADWIKGWTDSLSLELVCTVLEVKDGLITGRIEGRNCRGREKVRRIRERWNLDGFEEIYAYGDSVADRPMLALATKSFYKPFRKE